MDLVPHDVSVSFFHVWKHGMDLVPHDVSNLLCARLHARVFFSSSCLHYWSPHRYIHMSLVPRDVPDSFLTRRNVHMSLPPCNGSESVVARMKVRKDIVPLVCLTDLFRAEMYA